MPPTTRPPSTRGWSVATWAVLFATGALLASSATTARGTDLRGGRRVRLTELISAEERRTAEQAARAERLRREVDEATRRAAARSSRARPFENLAARLGPAVGLAATTGPGVRVSLNDAPRSVRNRAGSPGGPEPDDLVVHEQDVQAVINALWAGGATAMTVMGKRVIATTAVRCVGNTLLLHDAVYSPPFVIAATGEPDRLRAALDRAPGVAQFKSYVDAFGLGFSVNEARRLEMPAYTAPIILRYSTAVRG